MGVLLFGGRGELIGRRAGISAGAQVYRQEARGIGGSAGLSAGGAGNPRERSLIGRRSAKSAEALAYRQEERVIGGSAGISAGGARNRLSPYNCVKV
ncbi:hypothetical protein ACFOGI_03260 [Virgibacillus xinjiangensis]|uniref:Uncharacterized protein n=1 Tax=Virgibacillus xinjiangensis TaxID=393090 RepID=A0ABV7CS70_9BACI